MPPLAVFFSPSCLTFRCSWFLPRLGLAHSSPQCCLHLGRSLSLLVVLISQLRLDYCSFGFDSYSICPGCESGFPVVYYKIKLINSFCWSPCCFVFKSLMGNHDAPSFHAVSYFQVHHTIREGLWLSFFIFRWYGFRFFPASWCTMIPSKIRRRCWDGVKVFWSKAFVLLCDLLMMGRV